ncbi:hypothetical protein BGW80DRAFT_1308271 [Lactifluus volemus]|nr:hypothetical protein BGW80DRAFT_1308271 [Lactifluus volemus]
MIWPTLRCRHSSGVVKEYASAQSCARLQATGEACQPARIVTKMQIFTTVQPISSCFDFSSCHMTLQGSNPVVVCRTQGQTLNNGEEVGISLRFGKVSTHVRVSCITTNTTRYGLPVVCTRDVQPPDPVTIATQLFLVDADNAREGQVMKK